MDNPIENLAPFTSFAELELFIDNNATNGASLRFTMFLDKFFSKEEQAKPWAETETSYALTSHSILLDAVESWLLLLTLRSKSLEQPLLFEMVYDVPISGRRPLINSIILDIPAGKSPL